MNNKKLWIAGLAVALFLAGIVSFYASSSPDGLESVAHQLGFMKTAKDSLNAGTPLNGYAVKGVENARLSGGLAGVIGVFITAALASGFFMLLRRKSPKA